MPQNGRTTPLTPNSEGAPPEPSNGAGQYYDMSRRRDRIRQAALQRGIGEATREANGYGKADVEKAADELCNLLKQGRVTRAQVMAEQRADTDRMVGWSAAGAEPGTHGDRMRSQVEYRMRVRDLALAKFSAYELTSYTAHTRSGQEAPAQPPWKRRPGLPSYPAAGGPISRRF